MEPRWSERLVGELRAELGRQRKTAAELSSGTGIPSSTLSRKLSGRSELTLDELADISSFLGVSIGGLLDRVDAHSPSGDVA